MNECFCNSSRSFTLKRIIFGRVNDSCTKARLPILSDYPPWCFSLYVTSLFSLVIPLCPNVTGTLRCYFSVHHQRNTAGFCVVLADSIDMLQVLNWTLLLNSPDHFTQTVDVAPKHTAGEPTVRTARAQKATAAGKSLKGKALKQTAKVAGPKAKTGARQTKPTQAKRRKSSNGASTENDNTDSESEKVGQSSSNGSDEDDGEREGPSVQTLWYKSDYGNQQESSDFVDNGARAEPSDAT